MKDLEPITREETMLAKVAGQDVPTLEPVTREEYFLAKAGGQDVPELEPVTRKEYFLADVIEAIESGGGGGSDLGTKSISENGTYKASDDDLDGYSKVTVSVPASAVDSGTKSISTNGSHDVTGYASASVSVPNSYEAGDEGKVVSSGELVAQTSDTVTTNNTYDTTLINSLTVNVSGSAPDWRKKDGKTYLHINIYDPLYLTVNLVFTQSVSGGNTIDWGDGTTVTPTGTTKQTLTHTYSSTGEYVIKLTNSSGTFCFGNTNVSNSLLFYDGVNNSANGMYQNYASILDKVELGSGWKIDTARQFANCKNLTDVYISSAPTGTKIETNMFANCQSLKTFEFADNVLNSITTSGTHVFNACPALEQTNIPPKLTKVNDNWFYNSYALKKVAIPSDVTSIGSNAFYGCTNLISVEIPADVAEIANQGFANCYGLHEIHMKSTTPPTLSNANAFSLTNANAHPCVIYVPYSVDHSVLNTYKTASNWVTFASYMQEESA